MPPALYSRFCLIVFLGYAGSLKGGFAIVFSSLVFLCIFLPVTILLHQIVPGIKAKNAVLIAASLLFYAYGEPVYVVLLLFSTLANYWFGRLVRGRRRVLALAVVFNLALLVVFKYTGFLVQTANALLKANLPVPEIRLPIGISFFTFQAMSYVIDVYRGGAEVAVRYPDVLLYISFFPQLVAGPIVQYRDIEKALHVRKVTPEGMGRGMLRFSMGLGKKVYLANTCGAVADVLYGASSVNICTAWLGALAYMLQIYFDFSGYSDMAIGMGRMFGFQFRENFNYPYISGSVREFWRRWHISLSSWFRDYLYIPLGGNRRGAARTMANRLLVFVCTGIWHGANLTFRFWGIYHGLLMTLEEVFHLQDRLSRAGLFAKALSHLYTLLAILIGFVFFRAKTLTQGFTWVREMFMGWHFEPEAMALFYRQLTPFTLAMMGLAVVFSTPIRRKVPFLTKEGPLAYLCSLVLLGLCILALASNTYNPFIYFQF